MVLSETRYCFATGEQIVAVMFSGGTIGFVYNRILEQGKIFI